MNLTKLVNTAKAKSNFTALADYITFTLRFLDFAESGLQAKIVSQNENHYQFWQYKKDGHFNVSRPINDRLFYPAKSAQIIERDFPRLLANARDVPRKDVESRTKIIRCIYTVQQAIGISLDALPAGQSNRARKIAGDLFERLIQQVLSHVGVKCGHGTVQVPVVVDGERLFDMSYQHDLLIHDLKDPERVRIIGSVKTTSKDRIDKIFLDKYLYCSLTETALPHIAVFLNDVQRKPGTGKHRYGINSTFLTGHFKGFSIKLNPLDGVYYCDPRPSMSTDPLLSKHIKTIDNLLCNDLWAFLHTK